MILNVERIIFIWKTDSSWRYAKEEPGHFFRKIDRQQLQVPITSDYEMTTLL